MERKAGGAAGPGGTLTNSSTRPSSTAQAACSGAAFVARSHAASAFSPRANQGISRNDYDQPHYPESSPRARSGQKTQCSSIL